MAWAAETRGGFSLVEHPIPSRTLASPLHRHSREDEYSFVLEGRIGALLGDDVIYVEAGEFAFKPRGQWHAFWNPEDKPCRLLEIISPGGFEHFFDDLATAIARPGFKPAEIADLGAGYGLEFQPDSVAALCKEHHLEHSFMHLTAPNDRSGTSPPGGRRSDQGDV